MAGLANIIPTRLLLNSDGYGGGYPAAPQAQHRVRLLPFVIVCGGLLLATKAAAIYFTLIGQISPSKVAASAHSQTEQIAQGLNAIVTASGGEAAATAPAPAPDGKAPANSPVSAATPASSSAPAKVEEQPGQAEIELLDSLQARRRNLDKRERDLETREGLLQASEKRIDGKIGDLKRIEDSIKQLIAQKDEQDEARMASLVKVYETMKPKDAARIFDKLEMDILLQVAQRMKQAKIAAILAVMDSNNAKALTVELASKKPLPPA